MMCFRNMAAPFSSDSPTPSLPFPVHHLTQLEAPALDTGLAMDPAPVGFSFIFCMLLFFFLFLFFVYDYDWHLCVNVTV